MPGASDNSVLLGQNSGETIIYPLDGTGIIFGMKKLDAEIIIPVAYAYFNAEAGARILRLEVMTIRRVFSHRFIQATVKSPKVKSFGAEFYPCPEKALSVKNQW